MTPLNSAAKYPSRYALISPEYAAEEYLVVKSGELAGIITVTDICRALAEVLTAQFSQLSTT